MGGLFCGLLLCAQDKPPAMCSVSGVVVDRVVRSGLPQEVREIRGSGDGESEADGDG